MRFSLIPLALIVIPIAEIAAFIVIGDAIGVLPTLALVLVTAIIGSALLRWQGIGILNRIRMETDAGRIPGRDLVHGAMILVAGVLLLTPPGTAREQADRPRLTSPSPKRRRLICIGLLTS